MHMYVIDAYGLDTLVQKLPLGLKSGVFGEFYRRV